MKQLIPGVIIILGSPNSAEGELYYVARQRCEKGLQEHLNRPDWKIVLTGGFGKHFNTTKQAHHVYLRKYLLDKGLAPGVILGSVLSTNTLEDASLSKPIIMKHHVKDILVVSSDFHYERARYIFEAEYSDMDIRISFSLADTDESACGFDLQSQTTHEKEALENLKAKDK